jgi:predicted nuclease with TOPRIM domain
MDPTRTISELKSSFVRSQVRILSESLELPEDWRNYAVETEEGDLGEKVVEDVLYKVNTAAKQHNRVVYSSQAIHHVAHQIATLYWSSISQATGPRARFANGVEKTTDLSRHINITNLPLEIESQSASHDENTRYQHLRERLASLDQKRQQQQRRLDQLRHLQRLLEPFKDPQKDIQPNLVTRDGELIQELEKMRMLVARVGGRIAQQKRSNNLKESREYLLPGSDRRLEPLLDMEL